LVRLRQIGHCDLPFDSYDLEALDRLAQGGGELVEPFGFCDLLFEIFYLLTPETKFLEQNGEKN
jgi:hypothetical protein